jgi:hypothetical protein
MRLQAKRDGNKALDKAIKLLMCSSYGRTGQKLRESKSKITSEVKDVYDIYQKYPIIHDTVLANEKQIMLEYPKKFARPKDTVHLNAFILAYSQVIMNDCIDDFDGFTDWDKTFYYTDTDSLHIHDKQYNELEERRKDTIGDCLGQLHDDIYEVKGGKIIWSIFLSHKTHIDVIVGFNNKGKLEIVNHVRAKGVQKESREHLTVEKFERMIFDKCPMVFEGYRLGKSHKIQNYQQFS